jgi:hypothetical protein
VVQNFVADLGFSVARGALAAARLAGAGSAFARSGVAGHVDGLWWSYVVRCLSSLGRMAYTEDVVKERVLYRCAALQNLQHRLSSVPRALVPQRQEP